MRRFPALAGLLAAMFALHCGGPAESTPAPASDTAESRLATEIKRPEEAFQLDKVTQLPLFGQRPSEPDWTKRFAVFVYFNNLTCATCLNEGLDYLADMHQRLGEQVAFAAVVQGTDFQYLRNLRRIGRVGYPIYIEDTPESAGFPPLMNVSLVDLQKERTLLRFFPDINNLHLFESFEQEARAFLRQP